MADYVCNLLGGGEVARIFLWRNKKISAALFGGATFTWFIVAWIGIPMVTLVCNVYIYWLTFEFMLSNPKAFNCSGWQPLKIPDVLLREELFQEVAAALHIGINRAFTLSTEIAAKFSYTQYFTTQVVVALIGMLAICVSFSTLLYAGTVLLFTVPVACEKVAAYRELKRK